MANRRCETAFSDAECLGALSASLTGGKFNLQGSEDAYRNVLFSHFHDILTGSNVQDSREYAMGLMQHAHAFSQAAATKAMREISDATDTSAFSPEGEVKLSQAEGAGPGYNAGFGYLTPVEERGSGLTRVFTVFNPTPVPRRSNVEITVWDWQGDLRYVTVLNDKKEKIPFQLLDNKMCKFWDHKYFCFVADVEMDALSYATIALKEDFNERYYPVYFNTEKRSQYPTDDFILENENVRVTFDFSTGEMLSFIDKHSGTEYVREGTRAGFVLIDTEADSSDAWRIGRYLSINPVNSARSIHPEYDGEILKGFYVKYAVLDSSIEAHISLENNDKTIKISSKVDWNETAGETVPVLAYSFISSYTAKEFAYNIPAGAISRKPCEQDHPGLSYIAAVSGDGYNACIVTDYKYGFRGRKNGQLISTLINTANYPDPYPERGIQEFALHVGILPADSAEAEAEAVKLNHPIVYQPVLPHKGSLESSGKLFESKTEAIVISAVAPSDDGAGLIIRMYDPTGKSGHAEFTFNREIIKAYAVDLFEKEVSGDVSVDGKKVSVNVPHNGIITVKIF